ncbi:putative E3 ubiquitin-protein ligase LUL4 [Cinnamomum micranthum f. kanehirae]|uniref:RING-type E3 ubiquitin transferase n=1 Tax=Cinnamomum micranthum f. kanehirae TaxID=337451 RepID=A0A443PVE6_9MAGN|nr:putative E3 ubiquitin-protein ligase LUL4 [Cinnamomum micranthum f. kanehirae]
MGQSSSNRRNSQYQNHLQSSSSSSSSIPTPISFHGFSAPPISSSPSTFPGYSPTPPPPPPPPPPPSYAFAANAPYPSPHYPPPGIYPTPPSNPHFYSQYSPCYSNSTGFTTPPMGNRLNYPYYPNHIHGWSPAFRPSSSQAASPQPTPYVEHQKATTVKNDVNLHKETIRLEVDEQNPDTHLVTFTFDALVDGSITIFYFAKEGDSCNFSPQYSDSYMPVRVPFQKGLCQKFHQPPGTGIDLGFFVLEDLSKPMSDDVFPLVISAEACPPSLPTNEQLGQPLPTANAQITEAVIERRNDYTFQVKVIKQILWVNGVRYELRELFGIENSAEAEFDDSGPGKECVICMSEPKDTAVLPCRHMCMCSECAKVLRFQTNRCPICRQPVEKLIEINIKKDNQ